MYFIKWGKNAIYTPYNIYVWLERERERGAERDSIQSKCTKLKTVAKHFLIYVVLGWAGVPRQSGGVRDWVAHKSLSLGFR